MGSRRGLVALMPIPRAGRCACNVHPVESRGTAVTVVLAMLDRRRQPAIGARARPHGAWRLCRCGLGAAPNVSFSQGWRSAPPPHACAARRCGSARKQADGTAVMAVHNPRPGHRESAFANARMAPSGGTSSAGVPATRGHQRADQARPTASPNNRRAGTIALTTRWIGTNASATAPATSAASAGSQGPDAR